MKKILIKFTKFKTAMWSIVLASIFSLSTTSSYANQIHDPILGKENLYTFTGGAANPLYCGAKLILNTLKQFRDFENLQLSQISLVTNVNEDKRVKENFGLGYTSFDFRIFIPAPNHPTKKNIDVRGFANIFFVNYFELGELAVSTCGYDFYNQHISQYKVVFQAGNFIRGKNLIFLQTKATPTILDTTLYKNLSDFYSRSIENVLQQEKEVDKEVLAGKMKAHKYSELGGVPKIFLMSVEEMDWTFEGLNGNTLGVEKINKFKQRNR